MDKQNNESCLRTSSEIIKEAKVALILNSAMNTKIVTTNRPFTPQDKQRILFKHNRKGRPSSSISFHSIKFQDTESPTCKFGKINNQKSKNNLFRGKLPSLINHKSIASLEKHKKLRHLNDNHYYTVPEELIKIIPKQHEIYSTPVYENISKIQSSKNEHVWFPQIRSVHDSTIPNNLNNVYFESNTMLEWLDIKKSIEDNEINEARASKLAAENCNSIQNLISTIEEIKFKDYKYEETLLLLDQLYKLLQNDKQLKNNQNQRINKNVILSAVFGLLNSKNEKLISYALQIILLLGVVGENLATVCKLIFKISRSDKNDELFLEKNIIGPFVNCLGLAIPEEDDDALIYGYGALKFLMMNLNILQLALDHGILHLMALHLKMINLSKTEGSNFPEQTSHVLFQLTGCLRNIANDNNTHSKFATSSILKTLCQTNSLFFTDIDLVVNVARIISILSTNNECCEVIANSEKSLDTLLKICKRYHKREDIIVRIMYAIGNLLVNFEWIRFKLFTSQENVTDVVVNLLQFYLQLDLKLSLEKNYDKSQILAIEDVFIKIVRLIANMCIDENVGISFVSSAELNEKSKKFLDCILIILRRKTIQENEELIISSLSALNNLSYYSDPNLQGSFSDYILDISEALNSFLPTRHEECILEVGRVYSNLSRSIIIRKYLLETGGLNYIIDWLDSCNEDILLITTGILINMMAEKEARQFLNCTNGFEKLIQNLSIHAEKNWHLANLTCQVIWNFSIEDDLFLALTNKQTQNLLNILIDLLDEDRFFPCFNGTNKNFEYEQWEDFSVVATNILEKMEVQSILE